MLIQTVRGHLLLGAAMLSLAGCSGPEPVPTETASASASGEAAATNASTSPAADASAQPDAAPTVTPAPSASATPAPAASTAAKPGAAAPAKVAIAAPAPAPAAAPVVTPPPTWVRCAVCHSADKGAEDKIGPNLFGVYGHKMGQGSYAFSDAVKGAGLTLDEATLDKWLENPRALVPGNRMSFPGLKDPAKRAEIIAYLKQLH